MSTDLVLPEMPTLAHVDCPQCGHRTVICGEIDLDEMEDAVYRACRNRLEQAVCLIGEADEFFEEKSGVSYQKSKMRQFLLRLERSIRRLRAKFSEHKDE